MKGSQVKEMAEQLSSGKKGIMKDINRYIFSRRYNPTLPSLDVLEREFVERKIPVPKILTSKYRNKLWESS